MSYVPLVSDIKYLHCTSEYLNTILWGKKLHHFIFAITLSNCSIFLTYRHWSKFATKCLLLALKHALTISLISRLICWLVATSESDAALTHWRPSLVSDKHVPALLFMSVSPDSAVLLWFSCKQGWKIWTVIQECVSQTARDVKHRRWAVFIKIMTLKKIE